MSQRIVGEAHVVGETPTNRITLLQVPRAGTIAVAGFLGAVSFAPPAGYYRIVSAEPPLVEFHASAAGQAVLVNYEGLRLYVPPPPPEPAPPTVREYLGEFATATHRLAGATLAAFPDAIALTRTEAYAVGPVALGDGSEGASAYPWRARAVGGDVLVARMGEDDWGAESVLFSYAGAPITWLGLAFEGSGNAVVAGERATGPGGSAEIWIHHFDPSIPAYVFEVFGAGRCPAVILDDDDPTDGDVQVFCLDAAHAVVHRQQRNRYATAHPTGFAGTADSRLALAARLENDRLGLLLAHHNLVAGTWTVQALETVIFRRRVAESFNAAGAPTAGLLYEQGQPVPQLMEATGAPLSGLLRETVLVESFTAPMDAAGAPLSGLLRESVLVNTFRESLNATGAPTGGALTLVILTYSATESLNATGAPTGGTLVVVP